MRGKFGDEHHGSKKIKCLNTNIVYSAISEASRQLKLDRRAIGAVANKKRKSHKGFKFEFVEE